MISKSQFEFIQPIPRHNILVLLFMPIFFGVNGQNAQQYIGRYIYEKAKLSYQGEDFLNYKKLLDSSCTMNFTPTFLDYIHILESFIEKKDSQNLKTWASKFYDCYGTSGLLKLKANYSLLNTILPLIYCHHLNFKVNDRYDFNVDKRISSILLLDQYIRTDDLDKKTISEIDANTTKEFINIINYALNNDKELRIYEGDIFILLIHGIRKPEYREELLSILVKLFSLTILSSENYAILLDEYLFHKKLTLKFGTKSGWSDDEKTKDLFNKNRLQIGLNPLTD